MKTSNIESNRKAKQSAETGIAEFLSQYASHGRAVRFEKNLADFENRTLPENAALGGLNHLRFLNGMEGVNTPQMANLSTSRESVAQLQMQSPLSGSVRDRAAKVQDIVQEASRTHGVPVALINAVIRQESAFNPRATSHCGAMGLMQLMPDTARAYGCSNPYDPRQNIMAGTQFLGELLTKYRGNIDLALAGYNAGPGNVAKYGNQIPPFRETQNYVVRVQKFFRENLSQVATLTQQATPPRTG